MKGLEKLKTGDFNTLSQEWQSDGSVIITLSKRSEGRVYRFCVADLYGKQEKVLWEDKPPNSQPIKEKKK